MVQGSSLQDKLIGSKQRFYKGAGVHAMAADEQCWGIQIMTDNADITSITEWVSGAAIAARTDYTWENQPNTWTKGDFIVFDNPIVSLTLSSAAGSIFAYCEKRLGSHA
jgi:hypothetical protein